MTNFRNGYLIVLLIFFLFSTFVSCSGTGQSYLYKGPILNTESIALPDCKPAKGVTKIKMIGWLHPKIAEGQDILFEIITLVDWETAKEDDMLKLRIKVTSDGRLDGKPFFDDLKLQDFSCNVRKDGHIDNIIHTKRETLGAQVAFEISKYTKKDFTEWVSIIIPQFQVKNFKPGDTVAVGIVDLGDYVKGMDNFPIKSVYKGISTYNGKTVIVIEGNDKVVRGRLTGYQKGYILYDYNTRYIVASESEVKVNYDQTKVFRATTKISTLLKDANYHTAKYDGIWNATCKRTTLKSKKGALCSELTKIIITIRDSQLSGTAKDSQDRVYEISGYIDSSGQITGGLGIGGNTVVGITGYLSENSGKGAYKTINGCAGTWLAKK